MFSLVDMQYLGGRSQGKMCVQHSREADITFKINSMLMKKLTYLIYMGN